MINNESTGQKCAATIVKKTTVAHDIARDCTVSADALYCSLLAMIL